MAMGSIAIFVMADEQNCERVRCPQCGNFVALVQFQGSCEVVCSNGRCRAHLELKRTEHQVRVTVLVPRKQAS